MPNIDQWVTIYLEVQNEINVNATDDNLKMFLVGGYISTTGDIVNEKNQTAGVRYPADDKFPYLYSGKAAAKIRSFTIENTFLDIENIKKRSIKSYREYTTMINPAYCQLSPYPSRGIMFWSIIPNCACSPKCSNECYEKPDKCHPCEWYQNWDEINLRCEYKYKLLACLVVVSASFLLILIKICNRKLEGVSEIIKKNAI